MMNPIHSSLILPAETGTPATALPRKGLSRINSGTRTGTQVEQFAAKIGVPCDKVEPERTRNGANPCRSRICGLCSDVPLVASLSAAYLQRPISVGGQR